LSVAGKLTAGIIPSIDADAERRIGVLKAREPPAG